VLELNKSDVLDETLKSLGTDETNMPKTTEAKFAEL
jgi:hypothetical protein